MLLFFARSGALGNDFARPISFVLPKQKAAPASRVRFRLTATYFSLVRKVGKSTLRGENQAGEGRALMIFPLRTPILRESRIG